MSSIASFFAESKPGEIVDKHMSTYYPFFFKGEEGRFSGVDGVHIRYRVFNTTGAKRHIVIVPGRTECILKYAETIYDLVQNGYGVFCIDHRGQGFSERMLDDPEIGFVESFDHYSDDLRTFLQKVVEPTIAGSLPILMGHSMGCAVIARYVMRFGASRIRAIVLSAPMFEINTGNIPAVGVRGLVAMQTARGHGREYAIGMGPMNIDTYGDDLSNCSERIYCLRHILKEYPQIRLGGPSNQWLNESLTTSTLFHNATAWERWTAPVLFLEAEKDGVVVPMVDEIFPHVPGKKLHLLLENSLHDIFIETDKIRNRALTLIFNFIDFAIREENQA